MQNFRGKWWKIKHLIILATNYFVQLAMYKLILI